VGVKSVTLLRAVLQYRLCRAGLVFIEVELAEQLALPGQQIQ
jgi:hypothetical protein